MTDRSYPIQCFCHGRIYILGLCVYDRSGLLRLFSGLLCKGLRDSGVSFKALLVTSYNYKKISVYVIIERGKKKQSCVHVLHAERVCLTCKVIYACGAKPKQVKHPTSHHVQLTRQANY